MFHWIDAPPPEQKQRKHRGKSKLTHVHRRGEKREIKLSDLGQPVDDDEHLIREFSNFLGTTVREFVSLTCRSWLEVPQKDILWQYVKVIHFSFVCNFLLQSEFSLGDYCLVKFNY